ncbi:MAG: ATPase [Novosphingobium sp.]
MTGGSRIVAIGQAAEEAATPVVETEELLLETAAEPEDYVVWEEEEPARPHRRWMVPAAALLAIAGWTGFFLWANDWLLAGANPQQAIGLMTNWAVPVLLVVGLWILATRNSREEALRFGETARLLSDESDRLEARLTNVNRELSLAREFLASQSRDLDSLGRVASEKLSTHAEKLQSLIAGNGERIDSIATVSNHALDNMEKLRGQLPVIASSAKDASNNIANAGRTAHAQLSEMITGLGRLNEFGQASENHVDAMSAKIDAAIAQFEQRIEQVRTTAEARFGEIEAKNTEFRDSLDLHEVSALAAIRSRSSALMEELDATRSTLEQHETESLSSIRARLGALRDESSTLAKTIRETQEQAIQNLSGARERLESSVRDTLEKLDALDAQAIQASRERIASLSEEAQAFDQRLAERNRLFTEEADKRSLGAAERERAEIARIHEQLAELDTMLSGRIEAQQKRSEELGARVSAISTRLLEAGKTFDAIGEKSAAVEAGLAEKAEALLAHLNSSEQAASGVSRSIATLTDDSVRLLELLQASAQQSREALPQAIGEGTERLSAIETRIDDLQQGITQAVERAERLSGNIADTRSAIGQSLGEIGALHSGLEAGAVQHARMMDGLRDAITAIDADSSRIAEFSREELSTAIAKLNDATREAVATLEDTGERSIRDLASRLAGEGTRALDEALQNRLAEAIGELDAATERSAKASQESARRLRDQLARISDLTDNLERRVAQARERAEEQVDNDFARKVALITESLNSSAIDISKAMSTEVTDTAWAAYLRGDRGVFTRRAVRLLDNAEARSVAQIYRNDDEFRQHVSRYIHDFEAMLRQLLSTRDGHALSVTLLSSDMGKLYVALAQAIERLRD